MIKSNQIISLSCVKISSDHVKQTHTFDMERLLLVCTYHSTVPVFYNETVQFNSRQPLQILPPPSCAESSPPSRVGRWVSPWSPIVAEAPLA